MRIKDIKRQLFFAFLVYSSLSLLVSMLSFWLFQRKVEVEEFSDQVDKLFASTLMATQLGHYFLVYEAKGEDYYKTGGKMYLAKQEMMVDSIKSYVKAIATRNTEKKLGIEASVGDLLPLLEEYNLVFRQIVVLTVQKGAQGYGVEHRVRARASELEKQAGDLRWEVMLLRSHERDYLIRQDTAYSTMFHAQAVKVRQILAKTNTPASQKQLGVLESYEADFRKLVRIDDQIGMGRSTGLNSLLKTVNQRISDLASKISDEAYQVKADMTDQIINVFLAVIVVSVVMVLILAMLFKLISDTNKDVSQIFQI
jgi:CHASE3 domain sensor protein